MPASISQVGLNDRSFCLRFAVIFNNCFATLKIDHSFFTYIAIKVEFAFGNAQMVLSTETVLILFSSMNSVLRAITFYRFQHMIKRSRRKLPELIKNRWYLKMW